MLWFAAKLDPGSAAYNSPTVLRIRGALDESRLYRAIRAAHDWGQRFEVDASDAVLDRMSEMAPREMRRAWMTAFGNAKLDHRDHVLPRDLPEPAHKRSAIGFVQ